MAQFRLTPFSLGGPTEIVDPGDQTALEAQRLAQAAAAQLSQQQIARQELAQRQREALARQEQFAQEIALRSAQNQRSAFESDRQFGRFQQLDKIKALQAELEREDLEERRRREAAAVEESRRRFGITSGQADTREQRQQEEFEERRRAHAEAVRRAEEQLERERAEEGEEEARQEAVRTGLKQAFPIGAAGPIGEFEGFEEVPLSPGEVSRPIQADSVNTLRRALIDAGQVKAAVDPRLGQLLGSGQSGSLAGVDTSTPEGLRQAARIMNAQGDTESAMRLITSALALEQQARGGQGQAVDLSGVDLSDAGQAREALEALVKAGDPRVSQVAKFIASQGPQTLARDERFVAEEGGLEALSQVGSLKGGLRQVGFERARLGILAERLASITAEDIFPVKNGVQQSVPEITDSLRKEVSDALRSAPDERGMIMVQERVSELLEPARHIQLFGIREGAGPAPGVGAGRPDVAAEILSRFDEKINSIDRFMERAILEEIRRRTGGK